ncbi:D-lyxose/D-mannose family sugar isomerase [Ruficoccus amylovorans]|uniref:D-lyxose ketol-isomerase n=1 Tax=Ruficoccus amylovorans TaxID=1804625 RepID=A0A842HGS6_9BACT|nr:D-lyxose/D-mannose family sugar isomerase [Ruficoccus amylovorans]MBC2595915.1 D-lyxose/D-mannose family sugar isomerase [Ruficoccus amylovorans]
MKRSEINALMRKATIFLREHQFHLPPFAFWTPEHWRSCGEACSDIVEQQLGWDITDFGSGDFAEVGLLLFTLRNGTFDELKKPLGKIYGEKLLIVEPGQITPTHFHTQKMEDIINRGGGNLIIQLWNSTPDAGLDDSPVTVSCDGVRRTLPAGGTLILHPGESVCLTQKLYHKFWGDPEAGTVLVGEVNRVNDDRIDNHFYEKVGRFPEIKEDETPLYLLTQDYPKYFNA